MSRTLKALFAQRMRDPGYRDQFYAQMADEKILTCKSCGKDWSATARHNGLCSECYVKQAI